jgi:hypothetical protein
MSAEAPQPDPTLWRPIEIGDADPSTLAYLTIDQASESEVAATVYRWPHINGSGQVELERHCALRAPAIGNSTYVEPMGDELTGGKRRRRISRTPLKLAAGEIVALTTATDKLWKSSADLSDWSQLCLPLCRITEEANEAASAQFVPLAWTLWRDWLAQAPLIAHLARLAQRELSRIDGSQSPASIEARVDDDTEEFSSPEDYLSVATPEARERPDSVLVQAGGDDLWVHLTVARQRDRGRPWLKNSVLLEVGSRAVGKLDSVIAIHDRMVAAVKRGEPRWGAEGSSTSVAGFRPLDREGRTAEIPEEWRAKAERRSIRLLAPFVVLLPVLVGAGSEAGLVIIAIFGAGIGLLASAALAISPGVEFTTRRSERLTGLATRGLAAPLFGALAATVGRALGGMFLP